jgi:hypothetical protein
MRQTTPVDDDADDFAPQRPPAFDLPEDPLRSELVAAWNGRPTKIRLGPFVNVMRAPLANPDNIGLVGGEDAGCIDCGADTHHFHVLAGFSKQHKRWVGVEAATLEQWQAIGFLAGTAEEVDRLQKIEDVAQLRGTGRRDRDRETGELGPPRFLELRPRTAREARRELERADPTTYGKSLRELKVIEGVLTRTPDDEIIQKATKAALAAMSAVRREEAAAVAEPKPAPAGKPKAAKVEPEVGTMVPEPADGGTDF